MNGALHKGHRARLRQMIQENGLASLHPHQLLEYLLFYPIKRRDTNETAHNLLDRFKTLDGVFSASVDELAECSGTGPSAAVFLKLVFDIYAKYGGYRNIGRTILSNPMTTDIYLSGVFRDAETEEFCAVILSGERAVMNCRRFKRKLAEEDLPRAIDEISRYCREFDNRYYMIAYRDPSGKTPGKVETDAALKLMNTLRDCGLNADSFVFSFPTGTTVCLEDVIYGGV